MSDREPFGYVVAVDGSRVTLNLRDTHRGQWASHRQGVASVSEIGTLFGVEAGGRLLILRVHKLHFAEPREAHREGVASTAKNTEPLRHLEGIVHGYLSRSQDTLRFTPDSLVSPPLGAEAYPLLDREIYAILRPDTPNDGPRVALGYEVRSSVPVQVPLNELLPRHVAVLGATGQGKSSFTAAVLQQLLLLKHPRIVVFDISGEYEAALGGCLAEGDHYKVTKLGGDSPFRIPYYALGRHGLSRLLLPSERTQRPALNFALDSLSRVEWHKDSQGVGLVGEDEATLFDDCPPGSAIDAANSIDQLRRRASLLASQWPHMRALSCLVAESYCHRPTRDGGIERSAFDFGHIAPLVNRIQRYIEDPLFSSVVEISGGPSVSGELLSWQAEASDLVTKIFGGEDESWKLHILNLREVAHDLMPLVLGSLLELLAFELFRRGQEGTYPTLLVLEEAHHYLRQLRDEGESRNEGLAYERLAKEGRKFGLSLWISTQRPSEVSPTVLGQCGTWATFRLTAEQDRKAVAAASEWVDRQDLNRIAGLPRQQMLVFGTGVPLAVRAVAQTADPVPRATDPDFSSWVEEEFQPPIVVPLPELPSPLGESPPDLALPEEDDDDIPF